MMLFIISALFGVIGMIVSARLKGKFNHYAQVPVASGMTGRDVANAMLKYYNIYDVEVTAVEGSLTDHYNPANKTVNLSHDVYYGNHVSAAAVAAHECGHAVQHATAYTALTMRSRLVPIVNISANLQQYLFMFGIVGMTSLKSPVILMVAIAAFAVTTLFSLITLPVEFDASRRALVWLKNTNTAIGVEYDGAKDALKWAALTYVVAALAAITQLLYLVFMMLGRRD
ncbi:MAG: zinc metallopeptidase [Saprospiraceae bacterium]|jgi:Zn-dependent membrane protease YugP|nr:zinc metallopeptidase [Saprospiraceae bacterium]